MTSIKENQINEDMLTDTLRLPNGKYASLMSKSSGEYYIRMPRGNEHFLGKGITYRDAKEKFKEFVSNEYDKKDNRKLKDQSVIEDHTPKKTMKLLSNLEKEKKETIAKIQDYKDEYSRTKNASYKSAQDHLSDLLIKIDHDIERLKKKLKLKEATDINSLMFDEKNLPKTLATLANIDEMQAEKFISDLPLTDVVALAIAIQNKDLAKIKAVVGKHKMSEQKYYEAIDLKVANELRKISQMSPHQDTVDSTTTNAANTPPIATSSTNVSGPMITPTGSTSSTSTNDVSGTGTNVALNTSGQSAPALAIRNVMSADSKTGTVAIKNPQTKKVEIKNIKDPKVAPEIMTLIKNAGL